MSIEEKVKEIICDVLGQDPSSFLLTNDDYLLAGGVNMDSVLIIEAIVVIEETFSICFDDTDLTIENFSCISQIAAAVREKMDEHE